MDFLIFTICTPNAPNVSMSLSVETKHRVVGCVAAEKKKLLVLSTTLYVISSSHEIKCYIAVLINM